MGQYWPKLYNEAPSALHNAVRENNVTELETLLSGLGQEFKEEVAEEESLLCLACRLGHTDSVRVLLGKKGIEKEAEERTGKWTFNNA